MSEESGDSNSDSDSAMTGLLWIRIKTGKFQTTLKSGMSPLEGGRGKGGGGLGKHIDPII